MGEASAGGESVPPTLMAPSTAAILGPHEVTALLLHTIPTALATMCPLDWSC